MRKPIELGDRKHVDLVPGIQAFPAWRGVVNEGTPGTIPENALWYAQNMRKKGARWVSRGGQVKVSEDQLQGCVEGMFDVDDTWPEAETDVKIMWSNSANDTTLAIPVYGLNTAGGNLATLEMGGAEHSRIAVLNNKGYWLGDTTINGSGLKQTAIMERPVDGSQPEASVGYITWISNSDKGPFLLGALADKLWIVHGYHNLTTPNNGRLYSVTPGYSQPDENSIVLATVTLAGSFTYADTGSALVFNETSYFTWAPYGSGWVAANRASSGCLLVWNGSALSFPATPATGSVFGRMEKFTDGKLYMLAKNASGDRSTRAWSWNGTVTAAEMSITDTNEPNTHPAGMVLFGSRLYYFYARDVDSEFVNYSAYYDGVSWALGVTVLSEDPFYEFKWADRYGQTLLLASGAGIYRNTTAGNYTAITLIAITPAEEAEGATHLVPLV